MRVPLVCLLACALVTTSPAFAQPAPVPDAVDLLLARLETLIQAGDSAGFASLVGGDAPADEVAQFARNARRARPRPES